MSELGEHLIEGMKNVLAYAQGTPVQGTRTTTIDVPSVDVQALRKRLHLTQKGFATMFGFSLNTLRNWEQGTRRPAKSARILLALIDRHPDVVRETLAVVERRPRTAPA